MLINSTMHVCHVYSNFLLQISSYALIVNVEELSTVVRKGIFDTL